MDAFPDSFTAERLGTPLNSGSIEAVRLQIYNDVHAAVYTGKGRCFVKLPENLDDGARRRLIEDLSRRFKLRVPNYTPGVEVDFVIEGLPIMDGNPLKFMK